MPHATHVEGGLTVDTWCAAFDACHARTSFGVWQTAWPDGGCYWEQDMLTVRMFGILREELAKEMAQNNGR